jgi:hypothetical protein
MKRLFLVMLLIPTLSFGAYIDFYCNFSTGANINGGSDAGSVTYTSTNGNWSTATNIFTPTDGTNPVSAGVVAGQYASVYVDGATLAVFIAKVTTVVNAANGAITVSSSLRAGSAPSTSATGRSIKVGGAWKGPNAASGFPLSLTGLGNLAATGDRTAINLKNNASYVMTANIAESGSPHVTVQGYSSSARDGGKATIDGGTSGAAYNLLTTSSQTGWVHTDLIFQNNGASSSASGVSTNANTSNAFTRCVFTAMRGSGVDSTNGSIFNECESYGNNLSNTASLGGFNGPGIFSRCISHDNTGSNTAGFMLSTTGAVSIYENCIADTNGGIGFLLSATSSTIRVANCESYNNTSDGLRSTSVTGNYWIENTNFIKNGGWGINFATNVTASHYIYNCGFGAGTQVNTSGTVTGAYTGQEIGSITYASNVTPTTDPANGDFRINLSTANFTGRGAFTETAASYAGTVGYPDVGAAQSKTGSGGTFSKEVSSGYGY